MNILLAVVAFTCVACAVWFYFDRRRYALSAHAYAEALDKAQTQLNLHITSVDNLVNMLVSIHDFGSRAAEVHTRKDLARAIVDSAVKLMRTSVGSLMLLDRNTGELIIVASRGLPREVVESTRLKMGEGVAGAVARDGKPIFVQDIDRDPRFKRAENIQYSSRSFIAVPLRIRRKIVGVLNVNRVDEDPPFSERDLRLLTLLADQAAITIENLELYQNLQHLYLETMQTLSRAIDAKDSYTKEHADRSAEFARFVAKELHLPEALIKHIEYAAMMHDIGKIGVKEEILRKPGKLTAEEREEMKKHPAIGEKIIAPIEFLAPIAPLILYHHEWFDGSGYGEGLVGEEIPVGARIVAVIDAWDAMTSDRPYRKALPREVAVAELRKGAGSQFDPKVVEAFIKVVEKYDKQELQQPSKAE